MIIKSVFLYLGIFIISIFFTWIAEVELKHINKIDFRNIHCLIGIVASLVAIVIPCVFAALRDPSVGYDVKNYVMQNYNFALKSDSYEFFAANKEFDVEPFFGMLTYFWAKLNKLEMLFFSIELYVIGPLYFVLLRRRKKGSMTVGITLFLFLFYNFSLSGMRQSIAMSILIVAYQMFSEKKIIISILFLIVAFNFHKSVAIITLFYFLFYCISKLHKKTEKKIYLIIAILLLLLFVFYTHIALAIANILSYIAPRYAFYIKHYLSIYSNYIWGNIPLTDFLCKFMIIGCFYVFYVRKQFSFNNDIHNRGKISNYLIKDKFENMLTMMLMGRYFVLFNANFYESLRLAYYFDYLLIFFIPTGIDLSLKKERNVLEYLLITIFAFMYWFHFIMIIGGYATNIYMFK